MSESGMGRAPELLQANLLSEHPIDLDAPPLPPPLPVVPSENTDVATPSASVPPPLPGAQAEQSAQPVPTPQAAGVSRPSESEVRARLELLPDEDIDGLARKWLPRVDGRWGRERKLDELTRVPLLSVKEELPQLPKASPPAAG